MGWSYMGAIDTHTSDPEKILKCTLITDLDPLGQKGLSNVRPEEPPCKVLTKG